MKYLLILSLLFSVQGFAKAEAEKSVKKSNKVAKVANKNTRKPASDENASAAPPIRLVLPIDKELYEIAHGAGSAPDCPADQRLFSDGSCRPDPYAQDDAPSFSTNRRETFCFEAEQHVRRIRSNNPIMAAGQDAYDRMQRTFEQNRRDADAFHVDLPDGTSQLVTPEYSWRDCPRLRDLSQADSVEVDREWYEGWHLRVRRRTMRPDNAVRMPGVRYPKAIMFEFRREF